MVRHGEWKGKKRVGSEVTARGRDEKGGKGERMYVIWHEFSAGL